MECARRRRRPGSFDKLLVRLVRSGIVYVHSAIEPMLRRHCQATIPSRNVVVFSWAPPEGITRRLKCLLCAHRIRATQGVDIRHLRVSYQSAHQVRTLSGLTFVRNILIYSSCSAQFEGITRRLKRLLCAHWIRIQCSVDTFSIKDSPIKPFFIRPSVLNVAMFL